MKVKAVLLSCAVLALAACADNRPEAPKTAQLPRGKTNYSRLADDLRASGNLQQAFGMYENMATANPKDPEPLIGMGDMLAGAGQYEQAGGYYQRALQLNPGHPKALRGLATSLMMQGRTDAAAAIIDEALKQHGRDAGLLNLRGVLFDLQGDSASAQASYGQALGIDKDSPAVLNNLALSMALTGDYAAARELLNVAVRNRGAEGQIRRNLAMIQGLEGREDEAAKSLAGSLDAAAIQQNLAYYRDMRALTGVPRARAAFLGEMPESGPITAPLQPTKSVSAASLDEPAPAAPTPASKPAPTPAPAAAPVTRPATDKKASAPAPSPSASIADGYAVQLASFPTADGAKAGLAGLTKKLPGKPDLRIEEGDVGAERGKVWRIMLGPVTGKDKAQALCGQVKASGGNCLVVRR